MRIRRRLGTLAATCTLAAGAVGFGAASPAQAASSECYPGNGAMCVHVHNTNTDQWYWFGPWYSCEVHNIPVYDQVTWVSDNQYSGTVTRFYYGRDGSDGAIGSRTAKFYGRPPGYVDGDFSWTQSIRVC